MTVFSRTKSVLLASVACTAVIAVTTGAEAGGFAIREQSAEFQGMSFAGSAAGGSLSSMFWNSAAAASREGTNVESSYAVLMSRSDVVVNTVDVTGFSPAAGQGAVAATFAAAESRADGIAPLAVVGATYGSFQLSPSLYVGMGINAPFGLTTEPGNGNYKGSVLAQTSKLITFNFNPTVAYRVTQGVTVGVGLQAQTGEGTFRFASGGPRSTTALGAAGVGIGKTTSVEGNGWAFGATAGVIIEPTASTKIGVGYRSRLTQPIDGYMYTDGIPGTALAQHTKVDLELPDIVTLSIKHALAPNLRVAGTFEWTHWSRFKSLTVVAAETGSSALGKKNEGEIIASLPFNWKDSWLVSGGIEYDYSKAITVRGGLGYEKSPIDDPLNRSPGIPDNNRIWLSTGLTWNVLANTSIDLAYTHIFIEHSDFDRTSLSGVRLTGEIESSVDIISGAIKTRW